jgi:ABC-type multidrug transport system ATPase subunit
LYNKAEEEKTIAINQVLRLLNLYEVRNAYIGGSGKKSISGGQRKRVAIGIELISNPMVMVLDEPTSGLDSSNSLKIIKFLSRLAKQ